ncbi:MAG: hypothetical protein LVQ97_02915 [Candidatus Micrarchaeales archaeon]|jgi:hypothetical protein|uniref:Uncharacterized protein n=1 Tax=Candidatus Micrarchaeum acidiphilum ARMAN-2 TaxID=425595 RepID=C7DGE8_MICA2|nr:MAG: hypothetical protein UNLARM2_0152 [Candidatus Micrarchaeum acidiphilum ARMAN-2]MCW6161111.1 hypothetical protein [Candidatus Micrarchaeales archaeon]
MFGIRRKRVQEDAAASEKAGRLDALSHEERFILMSIVTVGLMLAAIYVLLLSNPYNTSTLKGCDGFAANSTRYQCITNLAEQTGNLSMCSALPSQLGGSCISYIAYSTGNYSICKGITDPQQEQDCIYRFVGTYNTSLICSALSNATLGSNCYYLYASRSNFDNLTECSSIPESGLRLNCTDIYYFNKASDTLNASYCNALPNSGKETPLYLFLNDSAALSNTSSININPFAYSLYNITDRSYCYYSLEKKTNNTALCAYVQGDLAYDCAVNSSINLYGMNLSRAEAICASAPSYVGSDCVDGLLISAAVKYHNTTYCGYITNSSMKSLCYKDEGSYNQS